MADAGGNNPTSGVPEPLMTVQEVAKVLRLSVRTIYTYFERGNLPLVRLDGATRVRRSDVEALIAARVLATRSIGSSYRSGPLLAKTLHDAGDERSGETPRRTPLGERDGAVHHWGARRVGIAVRFDFGAIGGTPVRRDLPAPRVVDGPAV